MEPLRRWSPAPVVASMTSDQRPAASGGPERGQTRPGRALRALPRAGPLPAQRPERRERVVGDLARPDEVPQRVEHLAIRAAAAPRRTARGRTTRRVVRQVLADRVVPRAPSGGSVPSGSPIGAQDLAARPDERDPAVVAAQAPPPDPGDLAQRPELVEEPRLVAGDPRRQDVALEDRGRDRQAGELVDDLGEPFEGGRCRGTAAGRSPRPARCRASPAGTEPSAAGSTGSTSRRSRASERRRRRRRTSGSHHSRSAPPGRNSPRRTVPGGEQPLERVVRRSRPAGPSGAPDRASGTGRGSAPSARAARRARRPPGRGTPPGRRPAARPRRRRGSARHPRSRSSGPSPAIRTATARRAAVELVEPRAGGRRHRPRSGRATSSADRSPSRRSRSWTLVERSSPGGRR